MAATGSGVFEVAGDSDWYRVRFEAGKTYMVNSFDGPLVLDVKLPDGSKFGPAFPFSSKIIFVAPVTGDYWVSATSLGNPAPLAYTITATELVDATPASIATPLTLAVGGSQSVASNVGDTGDDWFAVDLVAGQTYFASTSLSTGRIYMSNASGALVELGTDKLHFTAEQTGRYYVGHNNSGSGAAYTISLKTVADDRGETAATAGNFAVNAPTTGTWESVGDSDWHAITLTAGESYKFAVGWGETPGTSSPAPLKIYDSAGNLVSAGTQYYQQPSAIFAPTATGTYYVSASAPTTNFNAQSSWGYTLSASVLAGDLTDNVLTTGTLTVGTPRNGSWQGVDDDDWFAVTLSAGQSYSFAALNNGRPQLSLYDAAGHLVSSGGVILDGAVLAQTITVSGTYYVGVANSPTNVANPSPNYTVSVTSYADDFTDNSGTTGRLTVGGIAEGIIEAKGDRDWFAVQLEAGVSYALDGYRGGGVVRDAQGNVLSNMAHFTAQATGTYYIEVGGVVGDAYWTGITVVTDDNREDMLSGGALRTAITGTNGVETFTSTIDNELFQGLGGDDRFVAGEGFDSFVGGAGIDTVSFDGFAAGVNVSLRRGALIENGVNRIRLSQIENVEGSAYDDVIEGSTAANLIDAGDGNDLIFPLLGADTVLGGNGDDTIRFNAVLVGATTGQGLIDGGADYDTIDLSSVTPVTVGTVSVGSGYGTGFYVGSQEYSFVNVERILLGASDNYIGFTTNTGATLEVRGGDGADDFTGGGNYRFFGEGGNDRFFISGMVGGPAISGMIDGGAGIDTLSLNIQFTVDLAAETASSGAWSYSVVGVENVLAHHDSVVRGDGGANVFSVNPLFDDGIGFVTFEGRGGDDTLTGGLGDDVLDGGDGDDSIYALSGADTVIGGGGNDTIVVGSAAVTVIESVGGGDDTIYTLGSFTLAAGAEIETLIAQDQAATVAMDLTGNEFANRIAGNAGANVLQGGGGEDWLTGGTGDDRLTGDDGQDTLWGGEGNDVLVGGEGDDVLSGGAGVDTVSYADAQGAVEINLSILEDQQTRGAGIDTLQSIENVIGSAWDDVLAGNAAANDLIGGAGNDRFVFDRTALSARDHIRDFAGDLIDIRAVEVEGGDPDYAAFTFVGDAAFSGGNRELRVTGSGHEWLVEGDVNGDRIVDFSIAVTMVAPGLGLAASDFLL